MQTDPQMIGPGPSGFTRRGSDSNWPFSLASNAVGRQSGVAEKVIMGSILFPNKTCQGNKLALSVEKRQDDHLTYGKITLMVSEIDLS